MNPCDNVDRTPHQPKKYDYMRNLHIGPFQFHPYARYVDFEANYPEKEKKQILMD